MLNEAYAVKYFHSTSAAVGDALSLSLFIGQGSFMYAISTQQFKVVTEICHVELSEHSGNTVPLRESISFLIQNYLLERKKFEKVHIALLNTDFAMIPNAYASAGSLKPLLSFAIGDAPVKNILQHSLNGLSFCYTPDADLAMHLERTFPNASLRHAGAVCMQLLFSHHALKSCNLFLSLYDGYLELAAKNKGDLLFYNVFNYSSNEDVLYYLLFMMEQFELDPALTMLGIAAQRPADDALMLQIKKYIAQVALCSPDPSVSLSGELMQLPGHYYFTLLNQHVCEL